MGAAEATDAAATLAGRRLGRYEVLTQLASGGMATVYVARAQGVAGFERLVAVKVLHPHLAHEEEFITMFLDEARLAARIRHPNVVPTLDISDTEGAGYFLVMDYVEGDHLGAILRESVRARERIPPPVAVRILVDALSGLGAAHSLTDEEGAPLQLVHRDVSPHNIIVGTDGVARLTDFGVAKAEVRLSSTREGQFKGKLGYMAPEHASTGDADQRSDLFSMGIVLWESLAGRRLFRGETNAATLHKILEMPIPKLAEIDAVLAPFDGVLSRALARPPEERYQSAADFVDALEGAAVTAGGMSSTRAVSAIVQRHASAKLTEERARIKQAIATYGASSLGESPLPRPGDGSGSAASFRRSRPEEPKESETIAARPSTLSSVTSSVRGPRRAWLLVIALILVGAAGAGLALYLGAHDESPERPELPGEPTTVAVTAEPAPSEPVEPAPDEPLETAPDEGTPSPEQRATMRHRHTPPTMGEGAASGDEGAEPSMEPAMVTPPANDLLANPYTH